MTTRPVDGFAASVGPELSVADEVCVEAVGGGSGDPVTAGIELAVADAVDTIVDEALAGAADAQGDAAPAVLERQLSLTDAVAADDSGWAAAQLSAFQAAAANATAEVAKSLAETGTRHAKQQGIAAAKISRERGGKAAAAARSRAAQLATAGQEQATRTAGRLRSSGGDVVTGAASNIALQKITRRARQGAALRQQQATRLRYRRSIIIAIVAAIVSIAVGLYERRRGALANLTESNNRDVATVHGTVASDGPDAPGIAGSEATDSLEDTVFDAPDEDQPS